MNNSATPVLDEIKESWLARWAWRISLIPLFGIPLYAIAAFAALIHIGNKGRTGFWLLARGAWVSIINAVVSVVGILCFIYYVVGIAIMLPTNELTIYGKALGSNNLISDNSTNRDKAYRVLFSDNYIIFLSNTGAYWQLNYVNNIMSELFIIHSKFGIEYIYRDKIQNEKRKTEYSNAYIKNGILRKVRFEKDVVHLEIQVPNYTENDRLFNYEYSIKKN